MISPELQVAIATATNKTVTFMGLLLFGFSLGVVWASYFRKQKENDPR